DEYPGTMERDIRTVLGNFLFSGDDVLRSVQALSGGEKARLALAKLMMQKANFLVLDEPTNHLDIDSKEVLENALTDFPGTIIFVSHDRYFINKIADQVVELSKAGSKVYLGDYDYYLEKQQFEADVAALEEEKTNTPLAKQEKSRRLSFDEEKKLQSEKRKRKREIENIEKEIELAEVALEEIEAEMALPEVFQDHEKSYKLSLAADEKREAIDLLLAEWESLQEKLE